MTGTVDRDGWQWAGCALVRLRRLIDKNWPRLTDAANRSGFGTGRGDRVAEQRVPRPARLERRC